MNKPLFCLSIIMLVLAGCRRREDLAQLKAINHTLQTANRIIEEDNKLVQETLFIKLRDPELFDYAEIWEPKARRIKAKSDSIVDLIEELKSELLRQSDSLKGSKAPLIDQLYSADGVGYNLVSRLATFKDSFPAIIRVENFKDNPGRQTFFLETEFPRLNATVPLLQGYTDSLNADMRGQYVRKWLEENFSGISPAMALIALNRIENDLLVTANEFMNFCLDQTVVFRCGIYGSFSPIAILNSSYVKKGQPIEVTAGIAKFNAAMRPRISMNEREIRLDQDGAAVHRFTANGKPGEHRVIVKIQFNKPDGTQEQVSKTLKYIIADEK